tara:strand:- start:43 stop:654 length:612 start_codon:yes stop_codon:yes gene_type:complete
MEALIIFSSDNEHPLSWLLTKKRRHVWCAVRDTERGSWVSYNWHQGIPIIQTEAASDFDLEMHYLAQGYEVISTTVGDTLPFGPLQWNNCVGHVKTICAIRTWALVPNGLYKHLTRKSTPMKNLIKRFTLVPGFGGGAAPTPPPPPEPPAPVAKKTDVAVQKARADEIKRSKLAAGAAGTNKTKNLLADADVATTKPVLGSNA